MPQISPMNWLIIFMFFLYTILFVKKYMLHEKVNTLNNKFFLKMNYVK